MLNMRMTPSHAERQRLLDALTDMESALTDNVKRGIEIQRRVQWLRAELEQGASVRELVRVEGTPRTVEMLTANMVVLETAGSELRASLAHALRDEGLTIEAIADLYGVTRQRISALLRQRNQRSLTHRI